MSKAVRATHNQDGGIVLAIHTGKVLRLNPTGSLVFQYLQQGASEAEIVSVMCARFQLTPEVATIDLRQFLDALEKLDLISQTDGSPTSRRDHAVETLRNVDKTAQPVR